MDQKIFKCVRCRAALDESEIKTHSCAIKSSPEQGEAYKGDEVIEYLDTDSEDSKDIWTLEDTEHLLNVYHSALPVIYSEEGNNIDVWQTLVANLHPSIADKYDAIKVQERINYIFSYQARQLPIHKTLLPLLTKIEKLEKDLSQNQSELIKTEDDEDAGIMEDETPFQDGEDINNSQDEVHGYLEEREDDLDEYIEEHIEEDKDEFYDFDSIRWTGKEILRIIPIYRKHVKELVASSANKDKRKVWEKIANEMVMVGNRKCNPYLARMKIMNLKKTCKQQMKLNGESKWRYYKQVTELIKEEQKAKAALLGNALESSSDEIEETVAVKKRKKISDEPSWFFQYKLDAEKRHEEKMKLKSKLITILEQFAKKCNE